MEIDTQKIRALIDKRDDIDRELSELLTNTRERKPQSCGTCSQPGHSSRTCPNKGVQAP